MIESMFGSEDDEEVTAPCYFGSDPLEFERQMQRFKQKVLTSVVVSDFPNSIPIECEKVLPLQSLSYDFFSEGGITPLEVVASVIPVVEEVKQFPSKTPGETVVTFSGDTFITDDLLEKLSIPDMLQLAYLRSSTSLTDGQRGWLKAYGRLLLADRLMLLQIAYVSMYWMKRGKVAVPPSLTLPGYSYSTSYLESIFFREMQYCLQQGKDPIWLSSCTKRVCDMMSFGKLMFFFRVKRDNWAECVDLFRAVLPYLDYDVNCKTIKRRVEPKYPMPRDLVLAGYTTEHVKAVLSSFSAKDFIRQCRIYNRGAQWCSKTTTYRYLFENVCSLIGTGLVPEQQADVGEDFSREEDVNILDVMTTEEMQKTIKCLDLDEEPDIKVVSSDSVQGWEACEVSFECEGIEVFALGPTVESAKCLAFQIFVKLQHMDLYDYASKYSRHVLGLARTMPESMIYALIQKGELSVDYSLNYLDISYISQIRSLIAHQSLVTWDLKCCLGLPNGDCQKLLPTLAWLQRKGEVDCLVTKFGMLWSYKTD